MVFYGKYSISLLFIASICTGEKCEDTPGWPCHKSSCGFEMNKRNCKVTCGPCTQNDDLKCPKDKPIKCQNTAKCLHESLLCDFYDDCGDNWDESKDNCLCYDDFTLGHLFPGHKCHTLKHVCYRSDVADDCKKTCDKCDKTGRRNVVGMDTQSKPGEGSDEDIQALEMDKQNTTTAAPSDEKDAGCEGDGPLTEREVTIIAVSVTFVGIAIIVILCLLYCMICK